MTGPVPPSAKAEQGFARLPKPVAESSAGGEVSCFATLLQGGATGPVSISADASQPVDAEAKDHRPVRAERFDEHGFFQRSGAEPHPHPPKTPPPPMGADVAVAPPPLPIQLLGVAPTASPSAGQRGPVLRVISTGHCVRPSALTKAPSLQAEAASLDPFEPSDSGIEVDAAPEETAEPGRTPAKTHRGLDNLDGSTAPLIALSELEDGVRLHIRLGAMSREDRARLGREAATLLARHGLRPRDVIVTAPSAPNFEI